MTKIYKNLTLLVCLLCTGNLWAQRTCSSMEVLQRQLADDPKRAAAITDIEAQTAAFVQAQNPNARVGIAVTIPVVVHVVYNTTAENVSDAQIQSQINILNQDFRKLNTDVSGVPSVWSSLVADTEINFCLATRDPNGAATTGITRTSTTVTSFSDNDNMKRNSTGGKDAWPAGQYLNLWVCDLGSQLLGYAQFPGGPASTDGVVVNYTAFGNTGTAQAPFNKGRTTTHEVGHWLNLYHIWGDDGTGCTGSDNVSDTPNQADEHTGCPSFPQTSCSNGANGDMFMNYMDYTDDACMFMFTNGQKTRMQALFGSGGSRASLLTSQGCSGGSSTYCTSTGTNVQYEWIQTVAFGPISNNSGANAGYGNFTGTSHNVTKGTAYNFTLTPGFSGQAYGEWWRIWIDYNNDKDFTDAGELAYDAGATSTTARTGSVTIPTTAATAAVRMRVQMKYGTPAPTSCETFGDGEVEDYTLNITTGVTCNTPTGLSASSITTSTATLNWTSSGATSYNVRYKPTSSGTWANTTSTTNSKAITGLTASTAYEFQVQGVCSGGATSAFSASSNFTTSAVSGCSDYEPNETSGAAASLGTNITSVTANARICTTTDQDWYTFTTSTTRPKVRITLTNLPADYDVKLYNASGTQLAVSENSGTSNETINYNGASAGATYRVHVFGWNGAMSTTVSYALTCTTSATNFSRVNPYGDEAAAAQFEDLEVFPNPASGKATVRYTMKSETPTQVTLMDLTGKAILVHKVVSQAGENQVFLDLQSLAEGLYLVRIEASGGVLTRRLDVLR